MPSLPPTKPNCSVVVAFALTSSMWHSRSSAIFTRICAICKHFWCLCHDGNINVTNAIPFGTWQNASLNNTRLSAPLYAGSVSGTIYQYPLMQQRRELHQLTHAIPHHRQSARANLVHKDTHATNDNRAFATKFVCIKTVSDSHFFP